MDLSCARAHNELPGYYNYFFSMFFEMEIDDVNAYNVMVRLENTIC